jgi:hypothetical protein
MQESQGALFYQNFLQIFKNNITLVVRLVACLLYIQIGW